MAYMLTSRQDAKFMLDTPPWLLMSTAMRSMDHAMELMCKSLDYRHNRLCS